MNDERLTLAEIEEMKQYCPYGPVQRLIVALREAQKDTERLDWLECEAESYGGILLHDGSEKGRRGLGLLSRTLREAIDTTMDAIEYFAAIDAARGENKEDKRAP